MSSVTVDTKELKKLRDQLKDAQGKAQIDTFCRKAARDLAARLLRRVVSRTPVGDYSKTYELTEEGDLVEPGGQGGELRRAWLRDNTLEVSCIGGVYRVEVKNPKEYASYVEYGHRQEPGRYVPAIAKQLKNSWVEGKFMLTKSEEEIRRTAPKFLEKELEKWLREVFQW
ncbi:MAG: HK97 gp10 family phage protein [Eubacterium sp.]|nr:HK97 gp10 family phage protein [Eubacterium sp.]